MIELKHSVNLVAKIDEHEMPDYLFAKLMALDETEMKKLLSTVFIQAINEINGLETINENNHFAVVEWGDN